MSNSIEESAATTDIRAVKKKIMVKKADIRQCRLCLRILPRNEVRETRGDKSVDVTRKIELAVGVRIFKNDKLTQVCVNCLRLADIAYNFRIACMKTNIVYSGKSVMLHEGNWLSEEKKETLEDCQKLVRRHRMEMDELFKCTGLDEGSLEWHNSSSKQGVDLESKDNPVKKPRRDEIDDSDPEMTYEYTKMIENAPIKNQRPKIDNGSIPSKRYICEICGQVVDRHNEEFHRNRHLNITPYQCPSCPVAFRSKYALHRHKVKQHDSAVEVTECPVCHKKIRGKSFFKMHLDHHKDPNKHTVPCSICGKRYRTGYIKDHMNTHTGNAHKCEVCGRKFSAKNNCVTHMRKWHANHAITTESIEKSASSSCTLPENQTVYEENVEINCNVVLKMVPFEGM